MKQAVHLRNFSEQEIILSTEETRSVLKFFWPEQAEHIENAVINHVAKAFAQGLLVEAIDSSHSIGYLEATFSALIAGILPARSAQPALRIIKKFAREAPKSWFKRASIHDLSNVKVYETVQVAIASSFRRRLDAIVNGMSLKKPITAFVDYASTFYQSDYFWS